MEWMINGLDNIAGNTYCWSSTGEIMGGCFLDNGNQIPLAHIADPKNCVQDAIGFHVVL